MEEFVTACPRNCYSTCTFRVQVEGNRIRRILPYPGNLATPEGPCIKGLSYIERTVSDERIIFPLKKEADGSFKRISTGETILLTAGVLLDRIVFYIDFNPVNITMLINKHIKAQK